MRRLLLLALLLALATAAVVRSGATFTSSATNPQTAGAVADFLPPSASAAVVQKTLGGVPGYVKPGGSYKLYANVADNGSPPSGVAGATADLSALTSAATTTALPAAASTIAGVTYNHATATLTAGSALANGSVGFSLALADANGNAATQSFPAGVVVDGTPPQASDVQAANGGAQAGVLEAGDTLTLTYSEPIDPISIVAAWDGSSLAVTADVANGATADTLSVSRSGTALPLGSVALGTKYVTADTHFNATLSASGATVTLTLGSMISGHVRTGTPATMAWTPATTTFDRAGNATLPTAATESGAVDKDF
jgi:hypothetical protein